MKQWMNLAAVLLLGLLVTMSAEGIEPNPDFPPPYWLLSAAVDGEAPGPAEGRVGKRGMIRVEDLHEAIGVIRELHPELADWLDQLRDKHPNHIAESLHRRFPRLGDFVALKRSDPQMYELRIEDIRINRECRELAKQYHDAACSEETGMADGIHDELSALVNEHFDIRQRIRQLELDRLKMRIEQLHEQLDARQELKEELIEERLEELTGGTDEVEW